MADNESYGGTPGYDGAYSGSSGFNYENNSYSDDNHDGRSGCLPFLLIIGIGILYLIL